MRKIVFAALVAAIAYYQWPPPSQIEKKEKTIQKPLAIVIPQKSSLEKKHLSNKGKKTESMNGVLTLQSNVEPEKAETSKKEEDRGDLPYDPIDYLTEEQDFNLYFSKEEVKRWFPKGAPQKISFSVQGKNYQLFHPNGKGTGEAEEKTLYLADKESLEKYKDRVLSGRAFNDSNRPRPKKEDEVVTENLQPNFSRSLTSDSFDVKSFSPGNKNSSDPSEGKVASFSKEKIKNKIESKNADIEQNSPHYQRLVANDGDYELTPDEEEEVRQWANKTFESKVLSFGHGGTLTVKVSFEGAVFDQRDKKTANQEDFKIYENPFKILNSEHFQFSAGKAIYYEPAETSVSLDGKKYITYPCNKENPLASGSLCAGLIHGTPYNLHDLREYNLKSIRYIKVRSFKDAYIPDYNKNFAGFDLDAIVLKNAFEVKK